MEEQRADNQNKRSESTERGAMLLDEIRREANKGNWELVKTNAEEAARHPLVMSWAAVALGIKNPEFQMLAQILWDASGKEPENKDARDRLQSLRSSRE